MNGLHHQTAKVEQENENTINLVDSDSDSSLSELESETHSEDDGGDDSDDRILRPGLYALGLNKHYVPTWKSKDAFREFYQNWKDAIIDSFDMDPRSFAPTLRETAGEIQIRVHKHEAANGGNMSEILCGFIRYKKKPGSLELTNFRAKLDLGHLSIGLSSKRENEKFAGTHGEGFKLAALVLRRNERLVRITADSYNWNFGFRGRNRSFFRCLLTQVKTSKVEKQKKSYAENLCKPKSKRRLSAHAWEDVRVWIAKSHGDSGRKIQEQEFRSWLQVTLDLNPPVPAAVVETQYGDLILDPRFAGLTYLKGLRIPGNGNAYAFGYNYVQGKVNWDRDRIADAQKEQEAVVQIWQASIAAQGAAIIDSYLQLLREDRDCVEVTWTSDKMNLLTVKTIWHHLRNTEIDAFFYLENAALRDSGVDQSRLIKEELKKRPVVLSERLFKLFRKFSLILIPEEERWQRFSTSQLTKIWTHFGLNIIRAFRASLHLNKKTADVSVRFVDGGGTEQDFAFSVTPRYVIVHQKWLDFHKTHEGHPCETLRLLQTEERDHPAFFCDHVVEDLLEAVLQNAYRVFTTGFSMYRSHRRLAREKLRLMPRLVQIMQTDQPRTLEVAWIGNESVLMYEKHSKHIRYVVILHKESSCLERGNDLVFWGLDQTSSTVGPSSNDIPAANSDKPDAYLPQQEILTNTTTNHCGCASQFVLLSKSKARFDSLDASEKYFPMVARAETASFFGMPPPPIAPLDTPALVPLRSRRHADNQSSPRSARQGSNSCLSKQRPRQVLNQPSAENDTQLITEKSLATLCEKDEGEWREWFKVNLPIEFSKFTASSEDHGLQRQNSLASLQCPDLDFCFEKGEYASIRLDDNKSSEYLIYLHNMYFSGDEVRSETTYLLVTKYSTLQSTVLFAKEGPDISNAARNTEKEVLLHFGDFEKMGLQDDAETIRLDAVTHASGLFKDTEDFLDDVRYVQKLPQDLDSGVLFCRFAIHRPKCNGEACLTPVASHLLSRSERWREVRFPVASKHVVFDFTTGVLGASEGFAQAGFSVDAGVGFDPQRHVTWKIRYGSSEIYDGLPERVLEDMSSGLLLPPGELTNAAAPRIALMASGSSPFHLNDRNERMPSLQGFLSLLDKADHAIQSPLKPDFLVILSSPALLHPRAADRLAASLLVLLESRLSVHLKLCSVQDFDVPFERDILILIASPLCAPIPWNFQKDCDDLTNRGTIGTLIQDLAFMNPRTTSDEYPAFVCSRPFPDAQENGSAPFVNSHIYNHRTGLLPSSTSLSLDWDTKMLRTLTSVPKELKHPSRQDLLTVRELARLQGFPDDFIFYLSEANQYEDAWNSCPPAIARLVAKSILQLTRSSSSAKVGDQMGRSRSKKRARLDEIEP